MLCRCLNDREYERGIRYTIGQEVGQEEQDVLTMSVAPTFPSHEVVRACLRLKRKSVWSHIVRIFEDLFYI
jgi:hypothetical protein